MKTRLRILWIGTFLFSSCLPSCSQSLRGPKRTEAEYYVASYGQHYRVPVALAVRSQSQFLQMRRIFQFQVSSATLPAPKQLEQVLLSRNPGNIAQVSQHFNSLYGPVITATDAPQSVRDAVDMTDAEAQAAMKKSVEIDALADLELQAAEEINQQLQAASPGEAAILDAQASAWLVRANAYSQSAMAELVRVRSIELANRGTQMKFSSSHTNLLQTKGSDVLKQGVH